MLELTRHSIRHFLHLQVGFQNSQMKEVGNATLKANGTWIFALYFQLLNTQIILGTSQKNNGTIMQNLFNLIWFRTHQLSNITDKHFHCHI